MNQMDKYIEELEFLVELAGKGACNNNEARKISDCYYSLLKLVEDKPQFDSHELEMIEQALRPYQDLWYKVDCALDEQI